MASVEVIARGTSSTKAVKPAVMNGRFTMSLSMAAMSKNWSSHR